MHEAPDLGGSVRLLSAVLGGAAFLGAMGVFLLMARPRVFLGLAARAAGLQERFEVGELTEEEAEGLVEDLGRIEKPALLGLFIVALFAGATLGLGRL